MLITAYAGAYTTTGGTVDSINATPECYIVNLETGAWNTKYTGWDCQCFAYFEGLVYFGSANGCVYKAENGGSDDGTAYVFKYLEWPSGMKPEHISANKEFMMARPTFNYSTPFNARVSMSADYVIKWDSAPSAAGNAFVGGVWDSGTWDTGGVWDAVQPTTAYHYWRSIGRTGYRGALQIQMTINNTAEPGVEIVSTEFAYRPGMTVGL
jgi:hypothetical protein